MDILTIIANILIFLSGLITFACFGCFFKLINKVKTDPVKLPVKVYYIMAIILYITAVLAIWAAHTLKEESISPFRGKLRRHRAGVPALPLSAPGGHPSCPILRTLSLPWDSS